MEVQDPGEASSAPTAKRRGRPAKTPEEKRAVRNARDRERRKERHNGQRAVAKSPFTRGFALLDAMTEAPRMSTPPATALVVVDPADAGADTDSINLLAPWHPGLHHALPHSVLDHHKTRVAQYMREGIQGLADNSLRSMAADWRHWQAYCLESGAQALPVRGEDLRECLRHLIAAGYKRAPLSHLLSTLGWVHTWLNFPTPLSDPATRDFWRDCCRNSLVRHQHQAVGLTMAQVHALCDAADLSNPVHVRDVAIVRLTYDLLARPSEIAALTWADVVPAAESHIKIRIARSKTDKEGVGKKIGISDDTAKALAAWRRLAHPGAAGIFHAVNRQTEREDHEPPKSLGKHAVGSAMQRLARHAGVDIHLSGHSGRVGAAQDLNAEGFSMPEIMQLGRWTTPQMPARYAENLDVERAAQKRFKRIR